MHAESGCLSGSPHAAHRPGYGTGSPHAVRMRCPLRGLFQRIMFDVQEELKKLPPKPGVYIMHDERDAIIYVGKAVNLHNRVRSYFRKIVGRGPQIDQMVRQIARFEYIVTDSELEALILENNLIKEHRPKYNTMLKDDKTYPYPWESPTRGSSLPGGSSRTRRGILARIRAHRR